MEGKIFGIPLIIIILVLFIAGLVDVPLVLLHRQTIRALENLTYTVNESNVRKVIVMPTIAVTATPEATIVPTKKIIQPVIPTITP